VLGCIELLVARARLPLLVETSSWYARLVTKFQLLVRAVQMLAKSETRVVAAREVFLALLPKLQRASLELGSTKNWQYLEVEPSYHFRLEVPEDGLSRVRFKNHCGVVQVAPFFAACLKDVRVIGPWGIPVTRSGKIVVEAVGVDFFASRIFGTIRTLGAGTTLKQYLLAIFPMFERRSSALPLAAHLIPREWDDHGNPHFGHWLGEKLPQIRAFRAMENIQQRPIPLLINSSPTAWQLELLEVFGIPVSNLILAQPHGQRVKELIVGSLRNVHSRHIEIDPRARSWLAQELTNRGNGYQGPKAKGVFVFRGQHETRSIANQPELIARLEASGLTRFEPGSQDKPSEIGQLSEAEVLLGDFGSGLMNLLFMPNCRRIIEIFGPNQRDRHVFFYLAAELGIQHSSIEATGLNGDFATMPGSRLADIAAVTTALEQFSPGNGAR